MQLAGDHRAIDPGVFGDLACRRFQGAAYDTDPDLLVVIVAFELL